MCATGSDTVVATNLFVPEHRAVMHEPQFEDLPQRTKHTGEVTDYWTSMTFIRTKILGALLGTVEGILEYVVESRDRPILYTNFKRKGDSGVFGAEVGRAALLIQLARNTMNEMTTSIDNAALAKRPMKRPERALNRGQLSLSVDLLNQATSILMNAGGSSAFLRKNRVERLWRDFNVASRHAMLIPEIGYEVFGRSILGEEPITEAEFL
jgi:hypothetical protein